MRRQAFVFAVTALLLAWAPGVADDVTGMDRFICSTTSLAICWDNGTCDTGLEMDLNIPHFIEVDLGQKTLSTTKASGLNRVTAIGSIQRDTDTIILQGYESGRAFSYVIAEKTGIASAAIVVEGRNVAAFGVCTPFSTNR